MDRVVIVVSDLHLGKSDELEDFVPANEEAFCNFLKHQSGDFLNHEVDLVLLGDSFDIWQVAKDTEKRALESEQIDISVTEALDIGRVKEIVSAHPKAFNALRSFLVTDPDHRRIICTPGNHDHSLIQPLVQDVAIQAIARGDNSLRKRIVFTNYYENQKLGIYAEHGNQFDEDNDYDNFTIFGPEAPGYFFVRLFWNRLEAIQPNLDNWMSSFSAIWKQRLWTLFRPAYRLFRQYVRDERPFKRIQVATQLPPILFEGKAIGVPTRRVNLKEFPDLLFTERFDRERIFSTDNEVESLLRSLYHAPENSEFRSAVDEILDEKFHGKPPVVPQPSQEARQLEFLTGDHYVSAVRGMYGAPNGTPHARPLKPGLLKPDVHKFVLLGHTHDEKEEQFSDLNVTYFNTGSWSVHRDEDGKNASRLCYVVFRKGASGEVMAAQQFWKLPDEK